MPTSITLYGDVAEIGGNKILIETAPEPFQSLGMLTGEPEAVRPTRLMLDFGLSFGNEKMFFVTNTPGELPDSVFRLLDNLFITRMVNEDDVGQIAGCGLTDKETIKDFAPQIPKYHALALSSTSGVTRNFPLLFQVDAFQHLPSSGETRSMWEVLETRP